jgi:hypothetical protein
MSHSQTKGFETAFEQKAGQWAGSGPYHALHPVHASQNIVAPQSDPGQEIVVASKVFRCRVDDDVDTHFQRSVIESSPFL